ncbi:uncharacterized protein F4822DRAFT_443300 [Hypoxylon trugodes]|uniref:uncharacterized protein n=1 Tax=Hypoxylon trugodes TaxID=326681 RepID=UPI0021966C75|nr:uncharacterized protein F4822DRAFT_443300 [Hypoxylon trugodes]KAI1390443.1 hypothetical protein F4822DRAFT_443300 [Hypoxylon trugodes]
MDAVAYLQDAQDQSWVFRRYREEGLDYQSSVKQLFGFRHIVGHIQLPAQGSPQIFFGNRPKMKKHLANFMERTPLALGQLNNLDFSGTRNIQERFEEFTDWFGQDHLNEFKRSLGWGGNGITCLYSRNTYGSIDTAPREFIVKFPVHHRTSRALVLEVHNTKKLKGSAHCIKLIEPEDIGKFVDTSPPLVLSDDLSSQESSSGDESTVEGTDRYNPEYWRNVREERRKKRIGTTSNPPQGVKRKRQAGKEPIWDFMILEYMEHGDLQGLISKLAHEKNKGTGSLGKVPNTVLWSFWLCLIRACIAMEYPPRKFHPNRDRSGTRLGLFQRISNGASGIRNLLSLKSSGRSPTHEELADNIRSRGKGDLTETIPTGFRASRRQNFVHFDIDPTDVLIGGLELDADGVDSWEEARRESQANRGSAGEPIPISDVQYLERRMDRVHFEHELVPKLKMADFGLSDKVKTFKRNDRRHRCKHGFYAPEQFGEEWDHIPPLKDGLHLANSKVAGNYGPHTNVWGIAWVMWMLITKYTPPTPPEAQIPYDLDVNINIDDDSDVDNPFDPHERHENIHSQLPEGARISYCPYIMDPASADSYAWADKDLRERVYQCMYHRPQDRPTLEVLLKEAEEKVQNGVGEDHQPPVLPPSVPPGSPPAQGGLFEIQNIMSGLLLGSVPTEAPGGIPNKAGQDKDKIDKDEEEDPMQALGLYDRVPEDAAKRRFQRKFPGQLWRIGYNGEGVPPSRRGFMAMIYSLRAQFGLPSHIRRPNSTDLLGIYQELWDRGDFNRVMNTITANGETRENGPREPELLAAVLSEWARRNGLRVNLGVLYRFNREPPKQKTSSQGNLGTIIYDGKFQHPKVLWIYNQGNNHWTSVEEETGEA